MKNIVSSFNKIQNVDIILLKQASLLMEISKGDYYDDLYFPKHKPSPLQKIKNYKFHIVLNQFFRISARINSY